MAGYKRDSKNLSQRYDKLEVVSNENNKVTRPLKLLGEEESVLWYSELLLSVTIVFVCPFCCCCCSADFERLLVDEHRWSRLEEPNKRRLWRRSRLLGVGNDALRRFEERGMMILSFGLPPQMTSAKFVWIHWCVKSPSRSVEISPYRLWMASEFDINSVRDSWGDLVKSS